MLVKRDQVRFCTLRVRQQTQSNKRCLLGDPWGEAPKKCSTFLSGFKHKMKITSITKRGASHFSSDLERAPDARSIAVEKCEAPLLVTEIWQRAYQDILRSHDHFMGVSPRAHFMFRREATSCSHISVHASHFVATVTVGGCTYR